MLQRSVAKTSDAASVATSSTPVLAENRNRLELTLTNDGANVIYLALQTAEGVAPTAVAGKGIRLSASGGTYTTTRFAGAVAAIALTGATVLTVAEV